MWDNEKHERDSQVYDKALYEAMRVFRESLGLSVDKHEEAVEEKKKRETPVQLCLF